MNNDKEEIAKRISGYLQKNPDAGDTVEGITRWWLESEKINKLANNIAEVLESLIKKGVVRRMEVKGGNPVYKICKKD